MLYFLGFGTSIWDKKEFLDRLKKGKRLYGTAVLSCAPLWPMAVKQAGLDFVFIDTEHTYFDRTILAHMCLAYGGLGLAPLVRISSPDPQEARKVFDGGAAGVLVPYIESAEQAAGIHLSQEADLQIKWANIGANIILHSPDMALFQQRLRDDKTAIRSLS